MSNDDPIIRMLNTISDVQRADADLRRLDLKKLLRPLAPACSQRTH